MAVAGAVGGMGASEGPESRNFGCQNMLTVKPEFEVLMSKGLPFDPVALGAAAILKRTGAI